MEIIVSNITMITWCLVRVRSAPCMWWRSWEMWAGWFSDTWMTLALAIRSKPLPVVTQELWSYQHGCCASPVVVMQLLALSQPRPPMFRWDPPSHCEGMSSAPKFCSPAALSELNAFLWMWCVCAWAQSCAGWRHRKAVLGTPTRCWWDQPPSQVNSASFIALCCVSCRSSLREMMEYFAHPATDHW